MDYPTFDFATRNEGRRSFLKSAATAAAAAPVILAATSSDVHAQNPNYIPSLYRGGNAKIFADIRKHENDHVAYLLDGLGAAARPMPNFKGLEQPNVLAFVNVSRALENTGVGAYLGALPLLVGTPYLEPAASVALIEARHAGFLNTLLNQPIASNAENKDESFESPLTPERVVELAGPFILDLNGGPPLIPPGGLSDPIDVLNFALALEFLEAAFYNINVPKFT